MEETSKVNCTDALQGYGLQLDGNVVLVDEAHNLVEAIQSMHDATLTGTWVPLQQKSSALHACGRYDVSNKLAERRFGACTDCSYI